MRVELPGFGEVMRAESMKITAKRDSFAQPRGGRGAIARHCAPGQTERRGGMPRLCRGRDPARRRPRPTRADFLLGSSGIFLNPKSPRAASHWRLTHEKKCLYLALSFLIFLSAGCNWRGVRGNGNIKTEQRPVSSFNRIEAGGFYDIQWQPGAPSLSITTDENLLSHIETSVSGNVLKIETHGQIAPSHDIKVVMTSGSLGGAEFSGASDSRPTN